MALWICTLAAPGTAHSRPGNCTKTRRELHNPHGEPQRTTQQRRGTTQKQPGTVENCTTTPGNCTDAAGNCRKPHGNHTAAARDYPKKIICYVKISCSCFKVRFIGQPACYIQLVAREQHKSPGEGGFWKSAVSEILCCVSLNRDEPFPAVLTDGVGLCHRFLSQGERDDNKNTENGKCQENVKDKSTKARLDFLHYGLENQIAAAKLTPFPGWR